MVNPPGGAGLPKVKQKAVLKKASQDKEKWTKRAVARYVETGLEPGEKTGINTSVLAEAAIKDIGEDLKLIADKAMIEFLQEARRMITH
ncbi:MAG: hypothetical protein H0V18_12525 [Pyrinomonadaceae bacterium]|nr:hypothetical protein [Pyrinomonadaceae bacterium]